VTRLLHRHVDFQINGTLRIENPESKLRIVLGERRIQFRGEVFGDSGNDIVSHSDLSRPTLA